MTDRAHPLRDRPEQDIEAMGEGVVGEDLLPPSFAASGALRGIGEEARNELVDMEDLSDEELHGLQRQFETLRRSAEAERASRNRVRRDA